MAHLKNQFDRVRDLAICRPRSCREFWAIFLYLPIFLTQACQRLPGHVTIKSGP